MTKIYFKGGSGIENPVDFYGNKIKEGDILTFDWFIKDENYYEHFHEHYPQLSDEEIEKRVHEPRVIVKWNENGYFYGEGFDDNERHRLYMHDFCFKHTKKINNK